MTDLNELERLARAATPGPWETHFGNILIHVKAGVKSIARSGFPVVDWDDAKYIAAANPTTILVLIERLRKAEAEGERLRVAQLVPGVMHCAKCKFQLIRTNLYVNSGTTGPGDNKTEPCPNGCGPLWPVTWEQYAKDGWDTAERFHNELAASSKA